MIFLIHFSNKVINRPSTGRTSTSGSKQAGWTRMTCSARSQFVLFFIKDPESPDTNMT